MAKKNNHQLVRKILDWDDPEQLRVAVLVKFGKSDICIKKYCPNLSWGEISYRVKKSGFKRSEWRNGESKESQYVLHKVGAYVEERSIRQLPPPTARQQVMIENMKRVQATHA